MSFPGVLERGDDLLNQYPRKNWLWNTASHATCLFMIVGSKVLINSFYTTKVSGLEKLDAAIQRSKDENRSLLTVMNHMSVVDDPAIWACLPLKYYFGVDSVRWCLGAHNLCFKTTFLSYFFSLGKVLPTERFGRGPFQPSVDAAIRLLSPDDTLDLEYTPNSSSRRSWWKFTRDEIPIVQHVSKLNASDYQPPVYREKPSWVHVFPEGFVCQLEPPHSNSMRYFRWGISRMILEPTKLPIVVPIFSTGFEKIAPESAAETILERYLPQNFNAEINITIGDPIDDSVLQKFRDEWVKLCDKYHDKANPFDLSHDLKYGKEVKALRSKLAAEVRQSVQYLRDSVRNFPPEDARFKSPAFWNKFTTSEGASDPDVQFIGKNWAIKRLQSNLKMYDQEGNEIIEGESPKS